MTTTPQSQALKFLEGILDRCSAKGFAPWEIADKQWNVEADVTLGKDKVKVLVYFNSKGKLTPKVQGKDSVLKASVSALLHEDKNTASAFLPAEVEQWIGVDESGKGDYFGPLVTAAVLVGPDCRERLKSILVRDSKDLTDEAIKTSARKIHAICQGNVTVVLAMPERYNEMVGTGLNSGRLQKLLGWQHARAIENLLEIHPDVGHAICDQFGKEHVIKNALMERGRGIKLVQRTKAERDIAVAAASIVARDTFLYRMKMLEERCGRPLPLGSSNETMILDVVRDIVKRDGQAGLKQYAKLHFKTTVKMMERL